MDTQDKKKVRTKRRRRFLPKKRTFQASFLHGEPKWEAESPAKTPASDLEAFAEDTFTRLRYRTPEEPTDYRYRRFRVPQELKLNSRLVRDTLSLCVSAKATRPNTKETEKTGESRLSPLVAPQLLIAGLTAPVAEKPATRVLSAVSSQPHFLYNKTSKASLLEPQRSECFQVKYFNADIIPQKPQRTLTMTDIQKYLNYLGTKPFK